MVFIVVFIFAVILLFFLIKHVRFQKQYKKRLGIFKNSPYYFQNTFHNLEPTPLLMDFKKGIKELFFTNKKNKIPSCKIPALKTDFMNLNPKENLFVWFGHSSYFLQLNNMRFLIDPVFSSHASPVPFIKRPFKGTNLYSAKDMPPIDYLIITHNHYDHLDKKTVQSLKNKVKTIICPLGVGIYFELWGFSSHQIIEKDWGDQISLASQSSIHVVPARHFSGRSLKRNQTLWASYVLSTPHLNIFLGCDGGYGGHFQKIGEDFGPFHLAFLENGQYNPLWENIHAFPFQTLKIAQQIMPIHSSKFSLSSHPWQEPLEQISQLAPNFCIPILTPKIGEVVFIDKPNPQISSWWQEC